MLTTTRDDDDDDDDAYDFPNNYDDDEVKTDTYKTFLLQWRIMPTTKTIKVCIFYDVLEQCPGAAWFASVHPTPRIELFQFVCRFIVHDCTCCYDSIHSKVPSCVTPCLRWCSDISAVTIRWTVDPEVPSRCQYFMMLERLHMAYPSLHLFGVVYIGTMQVSWTWRLYNWGVQIDWWL